MINALPLFWGPPLNSTQGNGQTDGIGLDQPTIPKNPSDNPFAKILRDQAAAPSLLKGLLLTVPSGDQRQLHDLESIPRNTDLSVDAQSKPYQVMLLESDAQRFTELEDFIPTPSIPRTSLEVKGESEGGEAEVQKEPMGLSPMNLPHEGQLSGPVFFPQVILPGGSGADGIQKTTTINKPDLPFLAGYSPNQAPPIGRSLADNSATYLVTNSDRQQFLRDAVKVNFQLVGSSDGEPATESAVEPGKHVGKPLDRVLNPVQDNETPLLRIPPSAARASLGPLRPLVNQVVQASLPIEETPASFTEVVQSSQGRLKYVNGVPSLLSETSVQGKESPMPIPSNLPGDSSLSSTGDRSKDVLEVTGKSVGVDPNGGQGVNNGMGGSTHSQAGFQHSSSSLSQGTGARMAEERGPDPPAPALQRLQMEVQLSETNRIQIDVGVQQRQVYAGLLMDHATLKNLAMQFVPQLEEQLAQSDMDLQEFSAEVRDHHSEQESEASSNGSGTQQEQRGSTTVHHAPESLPNSVNRIEEQGWHFVA